MKTETLNIKSASSGGILKLVVIGALGIIGVALVIKMIKNSKKMGTGKEAVDDPNVALAMNLNTAMHPARSWLGDIFTGADKDEIFLLAQNLKDFETVATAYQNLYDESLSHELQDALGEDYPALLEKLGKVKTGTDSTPQEQIAKISENLYKDMNGLNWLGRDLQPYSDLLRLTDIDFKKCINLYNSSHSDFREMLENESGVAISGNNQYTDFTALKEKIFTRYDKLF